MTDIKTILNEEKQMQEEENSFPILQVAVPVSYVLPEEKKLCLAKKGIDTFALDGYSGWNNVLTQLDMIRKDYIVGKIVIFAVKKPRYEEALLTVQ